MSYQFPPGGFPPQSPGFPGGGIPRPPAGPPPFRTPAAPPVGQRFRDGVPLRAFVPCFYRNTFVWLRNGRTFWFWPFAIDRRLNRVIGYRWRPGQFRWEYYSLDPNRVLFFSCY